MQWNLYYYSLKKIPCNCDVHYGNEVKRCGQDIFKFTQDNNKVIT